MRTLGGAPGTGAAGGRAGARDRAAGPRRARGDPAGTRTAPGTGGPTCPPPPAPAAGFELFGYVRYLPGEEGGEPGEFSAWVDFTDQTAERNPEWRLDLCDEVIGRWRGEQGAVAAMTLIWGHPLVSSGPRGHGRAGGARGGPVRAGGGTLHDDRPRRLPRGPARGQAVRLQDNGSWPASRCSADDDEDEDGGRARRARSRSGALARI